MPLFFQGINEEPYWLPYDSAYLHQEVFQGEPSVTIFTSQLTHSLSSEAISLTEFSLFITLLNIINIALIKNCVYNRWMNKILLIILTVFLASCGGGGDTSVVITPQKQPIVISKDMQKLFLPSTDNPEDFKDNYEYSLYMSTNDNPYPYISVQEQSKFKGDAMLWLGFTKKLGFTKSKEYIDLANPNKFKYAYIYDEVFWEDGKNSIGENEENILEIARYAKEKGLKPVITIMPSVILSDDFKLKDINVYDIIAIDVYPSIIVSKDTKGCSYNNNLYTNLLYCSQKKLKNLGFKGQVWYIYQAMGLHDQALGNLIDGLKLQQETLNTAKDIGIDGLVPFGYYLSEAAIKEEPLLYQGYGSAIDKYVKPQ